MTTSDPRFCIAPFSTLFIRASGDVLPCCSHHSPDVAIGNIFHDSVDEILYGARAHLNRQRAFDLTLSCNGCKFKHKVINPKNHVVDRSFVDNWNEGMIGKLQVEIGYFCNSRCSFCDQPHMSKGSLPLDKIKEIVQRCRPKKIMVQGGEVYYNAGGPEFVEWLADNKGDALTFMHTNCVLPVKFAKTCLDGLDDISLNLYGASPGTFSAVTGLKLEKAIAFIEELVALRARPENTRHPTLHFKMTTCPTTFHEIPDAIRLGDRLKADNVRFAFDYYVSDFVNRYRNEFLARIWDRTNEAIADVSIPVHTKTLEKFGFRRGGRVLPQVSAQLNARRQQKMAWA